MKNLEQLVAALSAQVAELRAELAWLEPEIGMRKQRDAMDKAMAAGAAQREAQRLAREPKVPARSFTKITVEGIYDSRGAGYWFGGTQNRPELGPWHPSYSYVVESRELEAGIAEFERLAALLEDGTLTILPLSPDECVAYEEKCREDLARLAMGGGPGVNSVNGMSV